MKKLHPEAKLPTRATSGSAGWDLYALEVKENYREKKTYSTGIAIQIPKGYVGLVFPRSSISRTDLRLSNSVGVIDSDYRGDIGFAFDNLSTMSEGLSRHYQPGDRLGQLVVIKYNELEIVETDTLSDTKRGQGGFGSTGA